MTLIQTWAERYSTEIKPPAGMDEAPLLDPKHFALLTFLDHNGIFDATSDLLAFEARTSPAEYVGAAEGVEPCLDDAAKAAFEAMAREVFQRDHRSAYCRVGWYDDDGEISIVVTHGAPVTIRPAIEGGEERVISYRGAEHAVLAYSPATGRLKAGGLTKACRAELVTIFARTMLESARFFAGEDCQDLYTLASVERQGLSFVVDHAFDPGILRVQIVEVQLDRVISDPATGKPPWSTHL